MPTTKQRIRVAPIYAYEKAMPPLSVSVGGRRLDVSTPEWSTRFLSYWQPNWKTQLVGHFLAKRQGLFVDVGANVGQTLLDYLASSSRQGYLGFEPSIEAARNVRRIIHANQLSDCEILPVALSNDCGLIRLFESRSSDPCATTLEGLRPSVRGSSRTIVTLRFDELKLGPVALIKVDVEGGELSVLEGMRKTLRNGAVPVLCEILRRDSAAEIEPYKERMGHLLALIMEVGFTPFLIRKSPDLSQVVSLERVVEFPLEVFSEETRELNDYLLCPPNTELP